MADRFLCSDLMNHILQLLHHKFSIIYALKIYMWTLKYFPQETDYIEKFKSSILVTQNFQLIFHQNVFSANYLYLDEAEISSLLKEGTHIFMKYNNENSRNSILEKNLKSDYNLIFYLDRTIELATELEKQSDPFKKFDKKSFVIKMLSEFDISLLPRSKLLMLIEQGYLRGDLEKDIMRKYLKRK